MEQGGGPSVPTGDEHDDQTQPAHPYQPPGPGGQPPPPPAPGEAPSEEPSEILEGLRKDLLERQAQAAALTADVQALQRHINDLDKANGDLGRAVEAYRRTWLSLKDRSGKVKDYLAQKRPALECVLPEQERTKLEREFAAYKKELDRLGSERRQAEDQLESWGERLKAHESALGRAQQDYEDVKARPTVLDDRLKDIEALRPQLEAAEDQGDYRRAWVILLLMTDDLSWVDARLKPVADYGDDLKAAWRKVRDEQVELRDFVADLGELRGRIEALATELEVLRANRIEKILKGFPTPPASDAEAA
jgi:DNA repair exonuclease SbcCD ATPase subunit